MEIPENIRIQARELLRGKGVPWDDFIVLHLGPTWPVKEWPVASWASLVEELSKRGYKHVVHLGVGKHLALGSVDLAEIPGTVPLFDQLPLETSLALISMSRLFIGIDSGLLHCAISFGTKAVGLWGATSPKFLFTEEEADSFVLSTVQCQGCHHHFPRLHWKTGCPYDIACMKAIRVEEVLQACLSKLDFQKV